MARTIATIQHGANIDANAVMEEWSRILTREGYEQKLVKGEQCWSKGDGVLLQRQNFGIVFGENEIVLQAWMGDAILGESDLSGFIGKVPKKKMKKLLDEIDSAIKNRL